MPDGEIPRYCVKCGRNYFARYDVIDAQIIIWCSSPKCHEMQHTIPIYGFHARPASQQRQVAEMVERTERETNESQGSEFLRVHLALAEQNDTLIPCLAAGAAGMLTPAQVQHSLSTLAGIGLGNGPQMCKLTFQPLEFSEKDRQCLALAEPPKWNELGVPPALLQPENSNAAIARMLNPSLEDLEALRRKVALLQRVREGTR